MKQVPFLDLKAPYLELKEDMDAACRRVMESGWYILGQEIESFENFSQKLLSSRLSLSFAAALRAA